MYVASNKDTHENYLILSVIFIVETSRGAMFGLIFNVELMLGFIYNFMDLLFGYVSVAH